MQDFPQLEHKVILMIKWLREEWARMSKAERSFIEEIRQLTEIDDVQKNELSLIYNRIRAEASEPAPLKSGIYYCDFERNESCGMVG